MRNLEDDADVALLCGGGLDRPPLGGGGLDWPPLGGSGLDWPLLAGSGGGVGIEGVFLSILRLNIGTTDIFELGLALNSITNTLLVAIQILKR